MYNWLKDIHLLFSFGLLNNLEDIKQKLNIASFLCTVLDLTKNSVHNSNKFKKKKKTFHLPSTWKPKSLTSLKKAELSLAVQKCLDTREGLKIGWHGKVSSDSSFITASLWPVFKSIKGNGILKGKVFCTFCFGLVRKYESSFLKILNSYFIYKDYKVQNSIHGEKVQHIQKNKSQWNRV